MEEDKIERPITSLRRTVQILCLCFIIFGGVLGIKKQNLTFLSFIEPSSEYKEYIQQYKKQAGKGIIIAGPSYPQAFDTYLPIRSCKFSRETGTFRACFLHFVSESISWATPLRLVLPHVLVFLILAILFGRLWCGWVCPLGFIQDTLYIIRKGIKLKPFSLPQETKKLFYGISIALLISIIILSVISGISTFPWDLRKEVYLSVCQMCPSRYIFPYLSGWPIVHQFSPLGYGIFTTISIIFTLVLLGSLFIKRTWCRICPSGLLLSFFNRGALLSKEKNLIRCSRCGICESVCPLRNKNVYLEKRNKNINFSDCIHCFQCVDACPQHECLKVNLLNKVIFRS